MVGVIVYETAGSGISARTEFGFIVLFSVAYLGIIVDIGSAGIWFLVIGGRLFRIPTEI